MTSHVHWIITKNFSPIYILDHRIPYNKNFFLYRWAICRLSFNQVTIIVVFMYCCFVLFISGLLPDFLLVIVLTPWLLEWLSVTSKFIPLCKLDWVSWMTRQHWRLSKFDLCSSKESIKFCLLTNFSRTYFLFPES